MLEMILMFKKIQWELIFLFSFENDEPLNKEIDEPIKNMVISDQMR